MKKDTVYVINSKNIKSLKDVAVIFEAVGFHFSYNADKPSREFEILFNRGLLKELEQKPVVKITGSE